jgi:hypothetical protein
MQEYSFSITLSRNLQLDAARSHNTPAADVTKALRLASKYS